MLNPFYRTITVLILALVVLFANGAKAEIPESIEPLLAELAMSFKAGDYAQALKISEAVLAHAPGTIEALEVRALALKATGKTEAASKIYLDLLKRKWKRKEDPTVVAPYYFELGGIRFQEKRYKDARFYFEHSLEWNFNPNVCHFYLGNIDFQLGNIFAAATHFKKVIAADVRDLKSTAHFLLAQTEFKSRNGSEGAWELREARDTAQVQVDDPGVDGETRKIAQKILETSNQSLEPYLRKGYFGNVTLLTGYDSNVLSVPGSQSGTSISTTGNGSVKETLIAGIGYATPLVERIQLVPSYRMAFNYNFNADTRTGSFIYNDFSLYANVRPLDATNYGGKIEGIGTFQNQPDPNTNNSVYKPYSLSASVGPYLKHTDENGWTLETDLMVQPTKNYLDPQTSPDFALSGTEYVSHFGLRQDHRTGNWNPSLGISGGIDRARGVEYRSQTVGFQLSDAIHPNDRTTVNFSFNFSESFYSARPEGTRKDKLWVLDVNAARVLTPKITLLADVQTMRNISNVADTYEFSRYAFSVGANYAF